jgi:hypothetical protein
VLLKLYDWQKLIYTAATRKKWPWVIYITGWAIVEMPVKIEQKLGTLEGLVARWLEMWILGTRRTVVVGLGHPIMRRTASLNSLEPPQCGPHHHYTSQSWGGES